MKKNIFFLDIDGTLTPAGSNNPPESAKIKAAGYSDTVAVLLTNSEDLEGVECGAK